MRFDGLKYLVVGAGFFGATVAERIAEDLGEPVVVVERRGHIGGNCFSELDGETQIECHKYGTHIFHTSSKTVWDYITRFSPFNHYRHHVLTTHKEKVYQMPINLHTINSFYGTSFRPAEAREFVKSEIAKANVIGPSNLEEMAISLVGRPLYEAFIKGYTLKQWDTDPRNLPAEIIMRLPVIYSYFSQYFFDIWQGLAIEGYSGIFRNMLSHPNIELHLDTDYFEVRGEIPDGCLVIYTGPVDRFFEYKFGRLGWRTLLLEKEVLPVGDYQGTSVMNYADVSVPYTRIHEFRHIHPERNYTREKTVIYREYPRSFTEGDEPCYPMNRPVDREIYEKYKAECTQVKNVIFGGRLGEYRYFDMDDAIEAALRVYHEKIKPGVSR